MLAVWKRDGLNRRLGIECPACRRQLVLTDPVLTAIENGGAGTICCPGADCYEVIDVDLTALGGSLWTPPLLGP